MNALIQFKKQAGKPPVFIFRRSDGTTTWTQLRNLPIEHDLAHYAVERELQLQQSFYGLIDQGYSPAAFETPRDRRQAALLPVNLPVESIQTELMVGMLQAELISGPTPDFLSVLTDSLTERGLPCPTGLTLHSLAGIRQVFADVLLAWQLLKPGLSLELPLVIN